MLVALKEYHRRCEQHLERYISITLEGGCHPEKDQREQMDKNVGDLPVVGMNLRPDGLWSICFACVSNETKPHP